MTKQEMIEYLGLASQTHIGLEAMREAGASYELFAHFRAGEDGGSTPAERNLLYRSVMTALAARGLI